MTIATTMRIPVTKPYLTEEEARAPFDSIATGWVTQGPKVAAFERAVADYVAAKHGIATTSCTTALHLALVVAGVGPGDEVIVPSLTFIASANAIVYTGARPVFAEVDPRTYNVDPADVAGKITSRTRAIMPVDQIGLACDVDAIRELAAPRGIAVVEDAAPAIGETYRGRRVGSNADLTCFSFHPRKVITTGEGGMITTDDDRLADRARRLRAHGMSVSDLERHRADRVIVEAYPELGFNYRMNDIQASIGLVQLSRLDELLRLRRVRAERYDEALAAIPGVGIPFVPDYARHTYQSYCINLTGEAPVDRETFMNELLRRGIATRRGVMASHLERYYVETFGRVSLPVTEAVAATTVLLPIYPQMTDDEQDYVVDAIRETVA